MEELSCIADIPVTLETDLPGEIGLDSFGTMQVIVFLEDSYGIEVPEELIALEHFASVKIIADWAWPMLDTAATAGRSG